MNRKILLTAALTAVTAISGCNMKKEPDRYVWDNVAVGGGGFITGIVCSPSEEGLCYVRTDIGGAYRRDKDSDKWIPLTDHLGGDDWNLIGIESIASDPVEPNRVYLMCGTYTNNKSAILSSSDYGKTWERCDVPFRCGGNQSGRGTGERLAVDPHNNNIIYCGTRSDGLWRSEDFGASWEKTDSFPVKGDYVQNGDSIGIMWVEFDPSSNDIYAGAAMQNGECIYRSSDNGSSWNALPVDPVGYPLQAEISEHGTMYLVYSDTAGPHTDPKNGAVYSLDLASQTFTDITPNVGDNRYGGFGAISLVSSDTDTITVTSLGFWDERGDNIYRSTDGGETWRALYTNTEKNYIMDNSEAQWLNWGREESKTGWWTASVAIDPFDPDRVLYGTGATLYSTENMTKLGSGEQVRIKFDARGIEETAVFDIVSPVRNEDSPRLYSIIADLTGFAHVDVNSYPDDAHFMKNGVPESLAVSWTNGNFAVYTNNTSNAVSYTSDGGKTWGSLENTSGKGRSGTVAVLGDGTENGSYIIWRPADSPIAYTTPDLGETWFYAEGLGRNAALAADKLAPSTAYAVSGGKFMVSTDNGYHFHETGASVPNECDIVPVGDKEGHIWLCGNQMLLCSTDGGKSFEEIKNIEARAVGFGAPRKKGGTMTAYAIGTTEGGGYGIYRSEDLGKTWLRINDDSHRFGILCPSITGDTEIFGRVYLATDGRGIIMGDIDK